MKLNKTSRFLDILQAFILSGAMFVSGAVSLNSCNNAQQQLTPEVKKAVRLEKILSKANLLEKNKKVESLSEYSPEKISHYVDLAEEYLSLMRHSQIENSKQAYEDYNQIASGSFLVSSLCFALTAYTASRLKKKEN